MQEYFESEEANINKEFDYVLNLIEIHEVDISKIYFEMKKFEKKS